MPYIGGDRRRQTDPLPAALLAETIDSLTMGGAALLDRDWGCYSPRERSDAEAFFERQFRGLVRELKRLLSQEV